MKVVLGFFMLYFLLIFMGMGLYMDKILPNIYPHHRPKEAFHGLLFYYLPADLFSRFFVQDLPVMNIQSYLHLPIRKSKLIHCLLLRSLPNLFNLGMLLIFGPFMVKVLLPAYGPGLSLAWLASMLLLTLCNNYILVYFKRQLMARPAFTLLFGLVLAGLLLLDYFQLLSLRQAGDFSKGNQKKIGLAAAALSCPEVLILDEPFANLDPSSQMRLKNLLKTFRNQYHTTLLISSHDLNHVTEVCERIMVLEKGLIVQDMATTATTLQELEVYFTV